MNVTVPPGPNTATIQVLDANGTDISGSCQVAAVSSDPTQVQIGTPDAATPDVIPFTSLVPGGTANITYTATNSAGSIQQVDTLTIEVTTPTSMVVTYGTSVRSGKPAPPKK